MERKRQRKMHHGRPKERNGSMMTILEGGKLKRYNIVQDGDVSGGT